MSTSEGLSELGVGGNGSVGGSSARRAGEGRMWWDAACPPVYEEYRDNSPLMAGGYSRVRDEVEEEGKERGKLTLILYFVYLPAPTLWSRTFYPETCVSVVGSTIDCERRANVVVSSRVGCCFSGSTSTRLQLSPPHPGARSPV